MLLSMCCVPTPTEVIFALPNSLETKEGILSLHSLRLLDCINYMFAIEERYWSLPYTKKLTFLF